MMKLASSTSITALLTTLLATACVDTAGRFDQFAESVVDAGTVELVDATPVESLPDITGQHLLGLAAVIAPDKPIQFLAEVEFTDNADGTGSLDISLTALRYEDRMPTGEPLVATDVVVNNAGQFQATFEGDMPGDANPITGSTLTATVTLIGIINSEDSWCGQATGEVTRPTKVPLEGSTYAAIRVPAGAVGDQLPALQTTCPE